MRDSIKTEVFIYFLPIALVVAVGCTNRLPRGEKPFFAQSGGQFENTYVMDLLYDRRLVVAVWCDIDLSVPGTIGGYGKDANNVCKPPFGYFNSIRSGDGRLVEWCADTKDDKVVAVAINGKEYRLENGDLFLVRTRRDGAPVTLAKSKIAGKEPGPALWNRLAEEDAQVKEFIAEAASVK